jgi:hypothetical protein
MRRLQRHCVSTKLNASRSKAEAKAVPLHATKALRGDEVLLLLILDLSTRWGEWSVSRSGRPLPPGKRSLVPIVQEAGWAPEPV